jgi:hypothetical protein
MMKERVMRDRVAVMLENERKTVAKQSNLITLIHFIF